MNSDAAGGGAASWCDCFPPLLCSMVVVFITFTFLSADKARILTHKRLSETLSILPDACRVPQRCLVPQHCLVPLLPSLFESFISPFDLTTATVAFGFFCGCVGQPETVSLFSLPELKLQPLV